MRACSAGVLHPALGQQHKRGVELLEGGQRMFFPVFVYRLCAVPWSLEEDFDQEMAVSPITAPSSDEFRALHSLQVGL